MSEHSARARERGPMRGDLRAWALASDSEAVSMDLQCDAERTREGGAASCPALLSCAHHRGKSARELSSCSRMQG